MFLGAWMTYMMPWPNTLFLQLLLHQIPISSKLYLLQSCKCCFLPCGVRTFLFTTK